MDLRRVAAFPVLLLAVSARAADDDAAFARALAQRGYGDLAERVLERTASGQGAPGKRSEARLLLAHLRRSAALRAARARGAARAADDAVLRLFRDAETGYRAAMSDESTARTARVELARLLSAHAEWAGAVVSRGPASPLVEDALRLLGEAESAARAELAAAADGSPERLRADDEVAAVRLARIQALLAGGSEEPAGRAALARGLEEADSFTWDFVGTLRCSWAFRFKGLVLARMGRTREACESLRDAAISVTEQDGVPGAEEMALSSYEDLARVASAGDATIVGEAVATIGRLDTDWPHHLASPAGRRARIAASRLHARAGDHPRAVADARAALAASGEDDADAADLACAALADLGAAGADPQLLARIVRSAEQSGDAARTVKASRALIAACTSPEATARFAWDAWAAMGRAFAASGRWHEAFLAFDRIERAWGRDPSDARLCQLTETTAFQRADALARLASETNDSEDRARAERCMSEFARDHPESSLVAGAREETAFRALSDARALQRAGDEPSARARCSEALALLAAIAPESPLFERAQAAIAEAHRRLAEFDLAIRLAQEWLETRRGEPPDPAAGRARDQARAQALMTLLNARCDLAASLPAGGREREKAYRDALAAIAQRGAEFIALVPRAASQLDLWRAEAFLEVGEPDGAQPIVFALTRDRPQSATTRWLAARTASALDESAERLRRGGDARAGASFLAAAKLWEFVLQAAEASDPEVARAAGSAFHAGGELSRAADLLSLAAGLLRRAAEKADDPAAQRRLSESSRAASIELAQVLLDLARPEEAASEAESVLGAEDADAAAAIARLAAGEPLAKGDVDRIVARTAKGRPAVDVLARAYASSSTKERLNAAAQLVSALRWTLPRDAAESADSVELALRHADLLLRVRAAGGPRDAAVSAAAVLGDAFGSEEAQTRAETLVRGARERIADLRRRADDAVRNP